MDKPLKHDAKLKKPNTKDPMLYDSFYMKYPEQVNPWRQEADQWLPGTRERGERTGDCSWQQGFFGGDKNVLKRGSGNGCPTLSISLNFTL